MHRSAVRRPSFVVQPVVQAGLGGRAHGIGYVETVGPLEMHSQGAVLLGDARVVVTSGRRGLCFLDGVFGDLVHEEARSRTARPANAEAGRRR